MFWPCETKTSTCRNFATISSGLYRFLAITVLLDVKDIPQVGLLQRGRIKQPAQHRRHIVDENVEIGPNEISLDLLRAVYRSNHLPLHTRMRAAMAALKHEVPTLGVSIVVNDADIAARLDRAIARIANAEKKT